MIIKVMTRKEPSFRQLLAYVDRDARDTRYVLAHNLLGHDLETRAAEFEANAALLKKHQNGTVMFHDIVSITRSPKLGLERQKEILKDIVQAYIARRAPHHLVYAGLHDDHRKHLHYHLVISANPAGEWKRAHLSKPELRKLQADMETRVLALYPDLEQKPAMTAKAQRRDLSQAGHELKRRTGKLPERQRVVEALTRSFAQAQSKDELFRLLTDAGLELYRRGKTLGVRDLDAERNHRLSTLGLTDAFKTMSTRLEAAETKRIGKSLTANAGTLRPGAQTAPAFAQSEPRSISANGPTSIPQAQIQPAMRMASPLASDQEQPVDLLQMAFNGVSALAEALSIAPSTLTPVEEETRKVRTAVAKTVPPKHEQGGKLASEPKSAATALPPIEPVAIHTRSVKSATRNVFDPDLSPEAVRALTDARQAMVEERLAEISEARQKQDQQSEDQQGSRLKR